MHKTIKYLLFGLITVNVLYVLSGALTLPITNIDAIGIWFFKAKAIYLEHGFPYIFLHNHNYLYSHQQYPLGFPFFTSFVYYLLGGIHEKLIFFIFPIIYTITLILCYFIFKKIFNDILSLLFTYIFSMFSPLLAEGGRFAGQVDIFILLGNMLLAYILYTKKDISKYLWFVVLIIIISSQIKVEGLFLSIFLLFIPLPLKKKTIGFFLSITPFIFWEAVIYWQKIPTDLHYHLFSLAVLSLRFATIVIYVVKELFKLNNWYIFWILFILTLPFTKKSNKIIKRTILPFYLLMMVIFIGNYLFASYNTAAYVSSSFDRVLLQSIIWPYIIFSENINQLLKSIISANGKFLGSKQLNDILFKN